MQLLRKSYTAAMEQCNARGSTYHTGFKASGDNPSSYLTRMAMQDDAMPPISLLPLGPCSAPGRIRDTRIAALGSRIIIQPDHSLHVRHGSKRIAPFAVGNHDSKNTWSYPVCIKARTRQEVSVRADLLSR